MRGTSLLLEEDGKKRAGLWGLAVAALCFALLLGAAPASVAQLRADPEVLVFRRTDQQVTTKITHDGQPLPAGQMGEIKLWASGHDYQHMFRYRREDGALTLIPSETCEVGSYDLVMHTPAGNLNLKVYTPLDEMPGTLENLAASAGITVDQLRERMGLVTRIGTVEVRFKLPEVYYEGQVLELELDPIENAVHTWKINDEVVGQGPDARSLYYVFEKPGLVVVEYTATRGDRVVAEARDSTMVAKLPSIEWRVPKNVEFTLHATPGYGKYTWTINGRPAGTGSTLTHTFKEAGAVTIECLAEEPAAGPRGTFLRVTYAVTVTD